MGFILGFLLGLLAAVGLFAFLAYWLCSRPDNIALAKFINGVAQALAHRPKSQEPLVLGKNGGDGGRLGIRTNQDGRHMPKKIGGNA